MSGLSARPLAQSSGAAGQRPRAAAAAAMLRSRANEWLSYSTLRVVRIKDWRLGLSHLVLQAAVCAYLLFYTIVFAQRYRRLAPDVVGSTRLSLRAPAAAYARPPAALAYCGAATPGTPGIAPACRYLDEVGAVAPFLEPGAMLATSRVTETAQTMAAGAACANASLPACVWSTVPGSAVVYFVAELEMFTLLLDHTMSASSVGVARTAAQMAGRLVDAAGATLDPCDDYTDQGWTCDPAVKVGRVGAGADILPLRSLLRAAGVASLDDVVPALNETRRYAGMVLVVTIEYSNFWLSTRSWSEKDVSYVYSVRSVDDAEFKAEESEAGEGGPGTRLIRDRHGLRLVIKQSGTVGTFDFATLLITLTSGLGLLAVTTLIVDLLATRLLPLRSVITQYKTCDTAGMVELEESLGEEDELKRFTKADLVNPQPAFITRLLGHKQLLAGSGDDGDDGAGQQRATSSLELLAAT